MRKATATLAFIGVLSTGCAAQRATGPKLFAPEDAEVVWVTRSVKQTGAAGYGDTEVHGLFACYRRPASSPGQPVCYLAKYLTSVGNVVVEDMEFPASNTLPPPPAPTPARVVPAAPKTPSAEPVPTSSSSWPN